MGESELQLPLRHLPEPHDFLRENLHVGHCYFYLLAIFGMSYAGHHMANYRNNMAHCYRQTIGLLSFPTAQMK